MEAYRYIACMDSADSYKSFIEILLQEQRSAIITMDLNQFQNEVLKDDNTTVVFLDYRLVKDISEDLDFLLRINKCICIVLTDGNIELPIMRPYIYDVLDCRGSQHIQNFFRRLKIDMDLRMQLQNLKKETTMVYDIGKKLSAEKNIEKLLNMILETSMEITAADAGTLYLAIDSATGEWSAYEKGKENRLLKFAISRNNSIKVDFQSSTLSITKNSIMGYAALSAQPLRIEDAYRIPGDVDYEFNDGFDKMTGYRTKSILTVPMCDHKDRILGVLQLINKNKSGSVIPFSYKDEIIIYSLSGEAAVAIENSMLYKKIEELLMKYNINESIDQY